MAPQDHDERYKSIVGLLTDSAESKISTKFFVAPLIPT
jgi:hypothetical protein